MDGFAELHVFVRVVEAKSFTRAAALVGLTASGVSRVVARLEDRLGVRLLDRNTRSVGLTADGAAYYERCTRILRELEDANAGMAQRHGAPRGRLRVEAPTVLGRYVIGPLIPRFLRSHPELSVDLSIRDHLVDPIAEGIDVVLRTADLRDSGLVRRKLGAIRMVVVGSPRYLDRRGRPATPEDLRGHETIGFLSGGSALSWRFRAGGRNLTIPHTGRLHTNSADAIRRAAISGLGLARLFEFHVRHALARGALEVVLRDHEMPPRTVHALYAREKASLPKVRAFLDFLGRSPYLTALRSPGERAPDGC